MAWAYAPPTCAAAAGPSCVGLSPGPAIDMGTFLVRRWSSGWRAVADRRGVSRVPWGPQLLLDRDDRFHLFDGVHIISNASGDIEKPAVVESSINDTASMALTVGGKARVIYVSDPDGPERLYLMREQ